VQSFQYSGTDWGRQRKIIKNGHFFDFLTRWCAETAGPPGRSVRLAARDGT
jgi:hypothetical protein